MPPRPSNGVPRKVADFATPRVWRFISPVAAPFPMNGKGRGDRADPYP